MIEWEIPEQEALAALDREIEALWEHPQSNLALRILYGPDCLERKRARDQVSQAKWLARNAQKHRDANRECMRRARGYYERRAEAS